MSKIWLVLLVCFCKAEVKQFPGGTVLPHEKYVRVVSESVSPVRQVYIKTKDGLYVAAAVRKPAGEGPFPALIYFHGAPGGRGIEQLTGWSRGDTGGPVWERLLQEGFVVVVADYRGGQNLQRLNEAPAEGAATYADDGVAVVDWVRKLEYVDGNRIHLYGVSLGGDVTMHVLARTKVRSAILGAPAPIGFLRARPVAGATGADRWKGAALDEAGALERIKPVESPVLILVGTADGLIHLDRVLHDLLEKAGKKVVMEIYENGYHDFVVGPQGHAGRSEPLLDATLAALESSVKFLRETGQN
ncbi:MAG: hypothetical protein FJW20_19760 [Acidimicrobiia bacterium]|nr:hypothetical protein [Acidimicrobiia bacterium]